MSKPLFYIIFLVGFVFKLEAQVNLVPNPSFEDTTQCPFNPGQVSFAVPWVDPNNGSSDYFNVCGTNGEGVPVNFGGNQAARTGNAYMGLYVYFNNIGSWREYIQVRLDSQLEFNKNYEVEFYVSLADTLSVAANVSLYFSDTAITETSAHRLNVVPQVINNQTTNPLTDKVGWTKISGTYTANGSEHYITIGNFLDDNNTDTTIVGGGSYPGSYYYIDDVSVICSDCSGAGISELSVNSELLIYPNPATNQLTIEFNLIDNKNTFIEIKNVLGKTVKKIDNSLFSKGTNKIEIDIGEFSNGLYFIQLKNGNNLFNGKVVKQ